METLEILDAHRKVLITNMTINPDGGYTAYLMERYEADCRAAGIDPDSWEGLGR